MGTGASIRGLTNSALQWYSHYDDKTLGMGLQQEDTVVDLATVGNRTDLKLPSTTVSVNVEQRTCQDKEKKTKKTTIPRIVLLGRFQSSDGTRRSGHVRLER